MTLFLQLLAAAQKFAAIVNDPATQALLEKLREWFKSLPPLSQLAFASQFEALGGYGCANCDDIDCPTPPADCQPIVDALLEASQTGE